MEHTKASLAASFVSSAAASRCSFTLVLEALFFGVGFLAVVVFLTLPAGRPRLPAPEALAVAFLVGVAFFLGEVVFFTPAGLAADLVVVRFFAVLAFAATFFGAVMTSVAAFFAAVFAGLAGCLLIVIPIRQCVF